MVEVGAGTGGSAFVGCGFGGGEPDSAVEGWSSGFAVVVGDTDGGFSGVDVEVSVCPKLPGVCGMSPSLAGM